MMSEIKCMGEMAKLGTMVSQMDAQGAPMQSQANTSQSSTPGLSQDDLVKQLGDVVQKALIGKDVGAPSIGAVGGSNQFQASQPSNLTPESFDRMLKQSAAFHKVEQDVAGVKSQISDLGKDQ
eukprot:4915784-Karenia_brevis.AAC.1